MILSFLFNKFRFILLEIFYNFEKIYNFSAGPACLPEPALKASKSAVKDYKKSGISILEMSHRSAPIVELFDDATQNLINLLDIPKIIPFSGCKEEHRYNFQWFQ